MFDEYDRYLKNKWNIDYWYDLGVIQAAELVDNFRDGRRRSQEPGSTLVGSIPWLWKICRKTE